MTCAMIRDAQVPESGKKSVALAAVQCTTWLDGLVVVEFNGKNAT